jgi:putative ABC transport system substrate-binding protein
MRRREVVVGLGAALASPLLARAQLSARMARIGYLSPNSPPDGNIDSFRAGMAALGHVEGRDFVIETRYAHLDYGRFQPLVQELLAAPVDVLVTSGPATRAAPFAAQSVPVVFAFSGNPVDAGIVASFGRPGGNATGVSFLALDLAVKRVEVLKEAAPAITRVAVLSNPEHPGEGSELRATSEAARSLGLDVEYLQVTTADGFGPAFASIAKTGCDAVLTFPDALMLNNRAAIADFARRQRLPSIAGWKPFTQAGALVSYGPVLRDSYTRLAFFIDKILKGAKPADLPVEQPTRFELVVNLKTAQALGIKVPPTLLATADEWIE